MIEALTPDVAALHPGYEIIKENTWRIS